MSCSRLLFRSSLTLPHRHTQRQTRARAARETHARHARTNTPTPPHRCANANSKTRRRFPRSLPRPTPPVAVHRALGCVRACAAGGRSVTLRARARASVCVWVCVRVLVGLPICLCASVFCSFMRACLLACARARARAAKAYPQATAAGGGRGARLCCFGSGSVRCATREYRGRGEQRKWVKGSRWAPVLLRIRLSPTPQVAAARSLAGRPSRRP